MGCSGCGMRGKGWRCMGCTVRSVAWRGVAVLSARRARRAQCVSVQAWGISIARQQRLYLGRPCGCRRLPSAPADWPSSSSSLLLPPINPLPRTPDGELRAGCAWRLGMGAVGGRGGGWPRPPSQVWALTHRHLTPP